MSTKARFENNIKHTKQASNAKQYIADELKKLDRQLVATPETREDLENFANACGGTNTYVLVQMAINYGYKAGLNNVSSEL